MHGTVHNADGTAIKHAWVEIPIEDGIEIFEPQTGQIMTQDHFAAARPIEDHRYTTEEAALMLLKFNAHGAWESAEFLAVNEKIEAGAAIEIVPPGDVIANETINEETPGILPNTEGGFPEGFGDYSQVDLEALRIRRPRTLDWDDEQLGIESALGNPAISDAVIIPPEIASAREKAKATIDRLQDGYIEARESEDKDRIKKVEKTINRIANDIGVPHKDLLGKHWDSLPPEIRTRLALSLLPNKSIKFSGAREIFDMEYFMQFMEELTGAPFYSILRRIEAGNASAQTSKEVVLRDIVKDHTYKNIRTDEVALDRVSQELNHRNEIQGIESPEGITPEELLLVDRIQEIYDSYKPVVRYLRVMRILPEAEAFKSEFPDAVEDGKELELAWALRLR
ncbi:hypothetical protein LCGC14_2637080, partial [marine sediment metagenome]